ncbi:MAG TPA: hypothetical protein VKU89_03085 [Solirubrobacteraceae bacterium]|nr:hypothetical protein [Solirubrobacteraceae bacterium]
MSHLQTAEPASATLPPPSPRAIGSPRLTVAAALALAILLAAIYLAVSPPSGDLAAATYRADLFSRYGLLLYDTGWYAGHYLLAYSIIVPALGAAIGLRMLLALSAVVAAGGFALLALRAFSTAGAARAAALSFAFGFCAELPSGRVPFDVGSAIGLLALVALAHAPPAGPARLLSLMAAGALCVLSATASPVAGVFLALAGGALALSVLAGRLTSFTRSPRRLARRSDECPRHALAVALLLISASLAPIAALVLAFPEGGYEPFVAGAFWPELAAGLAVAMLLPHGHLPHWLHRTIRIGALLYAILLVGSFLIESPFGGNAVRVGALFGAPLLLGCLWNAAIARSLRPRAWIAIAAAIAPLLLYWQLATAIDDQLALAGDRTVKRTFYAPLIAELQRLSRGRPTRVEIPMTGAHWEAAYLPGGGLMLARGWERQLDTRYNALFYRPQLSASAYRRWLLENAVSYVALPQARLDSAGRPEGRLIRAGLPYLHRLWRNRDWRLYAVEHAAPLVQAPARLLELGPQSLLVSAPHPGRYRLAFHFSRYWTLAQGSGCLVRAAGNWTILEAAAAGTLRITVSFSLGALLGDSHRSCRGPTARSPGARGAGGGLR